MRLSILMKLSTNPVVASKSFKDTDKLIRIESIGYSGICKHEELLRVELVLGRHPGMSD